jgi:hypothetical protein
MPLLKVKPPYASTTSDPDKTIADINRLLRKYGINDYQWTTLWDQAVVELRVMIESTGSDGKLRKIGIKVTPPIFKAKRRIWDAKKGHYVSQELPNYSQAMRLLFHWLKIKIESVAFGLKEVEEEFMSDLIVRSPDGRESTLGKAFKLQIANGVTALPFLPSKDESEDHVIDAEYKEAP